MKHTPNLSGGIIQWDKDDWNAGLGPQGSISVSPAYLTQVESNGLNTVSNIDPAAFYGNIVPGYAPGANSTNFSSLGGTVVSMQMKNQTVALGLDSVGKIHELTVSSNTITTGTFPYTIAGTSPKGQDSILYRHNSSSVSVASWFASYYNNANWDVCAQVNLTGTPDYDFMSSIPATPLDITTGDGDDVTQWSTSVPVPHPMEIGIDGILYIGSGRYLHAYDGATGANGTFYSKVLTLPLGFQMTAMLKLTDRFLIAGNYYSTSTVGTVGEALLYTWDYVSSDVSTVTPLEDFYVSAMFLWNGAPTVITQGVPTRNGTNKVKVISGNSVLTVASFNGTIPLNRGVIVINDIVYMNAGGKILTIGNKFKKTYGVNHLHTTSNTGTSGCLLYGDVISALIASSSDGTPCVNTIYSTNGVGAGWLSTFFYDPQFQYNKIGRIKSVIVKYGKVLAAGGTNGTLSLILYTDAASSQYLVVNALSAVTTPLQKKYSLTTAGANLPAFSSISMALSWGTSTAGASPMVTSVTLEYELIDLSV